MKIFLFLFLSVSSVLGMEIVPVDESSGSKKISVEIDIKTIKAYLQQQLKIFKTYSVIIGKDKVIFVGLSQTKYSNIKKICQKIPPTIILNLNGNIKRYRQHLIPYLIGKKNRTFIIKDHELQLEYSIKNN